MGIDEAWEYGGIVEAFGGLVGQVTDVGDHATVVDGDSDIALEAMVDVGEICLDDLSVRHGCVVRRA